MKLNEHERFMIIAEEFKAKEDRTLDTYDELLRERLGNISAKTLQRYIESFMFKYGNIEQIPNRRKKTYKMIQTVDLVKEAFEKDKNINILLEMIRQNDPKMFQELEKSTKKDNSIYLFKSSPIEKFESFETEEIFKKLERIIKAKEYLKLTFKANNKTVDNLKALKLVWVDNNWYIAYVDENSALRLSRLSFLKSIDYGSNSRSFQSSSVKRQEKFLKEELQNSLTLYDKEKKIATIKATPEVSKYFKKGMKTFLSSQKFKEELEDGSIIFTLTYTQDLEILRFIQSWMPDLVILEPTELINSYKQKLKKILEIL